MNSLTNRSRREIIEDVVYQGSNISFVEPSPFYTINYKSSQFHKFIQSQEWVNHDYTLEVNDLINQVFETMLNNNLLQNTVKGIIIHHYGTMIYYFKNVESTGNEYTIIPLELIAKELKYRYSNISIPVSITCILTSCLILFALYNCKLITK